jgi:hypothetical protein
MFICKEDAKKYFGNKSFVAPMQKTTCDVCGKDKECYNIPYRVSMKEIVQKAKKAISDELLICEYFRLDNTDKCRTGCGSERVPKEGHCPYKPRNGWEGSRPNSPPFQDTCKCYKKTILRGPGALPRGL